MEDFRKKRLAPAPVPEANRRRLGVVQHDERGNAYVTWHDAPSDEKREVLEILGEPALQVKSEPVSYDPYARHVPQAAAARGKPSKPKDLRKLGQWLKMMKELEERRRAGEAD
ncbi:MAG: hypothetical protein JSR36_12250 [Proteobacteria bacterium]|nr:hypothetical protein [Pseudomonadota bacterium]